MWTCLKFIYFVLNLVIAQTSKSICVGKHSVPLNNNNFVFLKRFISKIYTHGFEIDPKSVIYENNGQTVVIKYLYGQIKPTINGGPYQNDSYQLEFMYFNWLRDAIDLGIDVIPVELHLVFFDLKYKTYEKALKENFGLTVWSYRYNPAKHFNLLPENDFYKSLNLMDKANTKAKWYQWDIYFPNLFILIDYEPNYYYVYQGRLLSFIQDCSKDVIWVEFPNKLSLRWEDFESMQKLMSSNDIPLMKQFVDMIAPSGPIYQRIDDLDEDFENLSTSGFEYFNATNIDESSAVHYNENVILILSCGFLILIF